MVNNWYAEKGAIPNEGLPMLDTKNQHDDLEVGRLLAGAAKTVARVRYCWLLTEAGSSIANARPMGRLLPAPDETNWTMRFVTDGRSRKAAEIRRGGRVELIFQSDGDDAFLTLIGNASLIERASEVDRLWKDSFAPYFPTAADRANAAFVEIDVARMELWIRGVTPEPFGLHPTTLERKGEGAWRLCDRAMAAVQ